MNSGPKEYSPDAKSMNAKKAPKLNIKSQPPKVAFKDEVRQPIHLIQTTEAPGFINPVL
jgi:hypothetical protein